MQEKRKEYNEKELKGFEKVQLAPGETKTVTMELDKRSFAWYNTELQDVYKRQLMECVSLCL